MDDNKKLTEEEILAKPVDKEELKQVSGGWGENWGDGGYFRPDGCGSTFAKDTDENNCTYQWKRNIYSPAFPNCAATVGDGSWCGDNDACFSGAVSYQGMKDCSKAWK